MADVQKVVAARIQSTSSSAAHASTLQPQPPFFGNIIAEGGEGNELRAILWQDGLVQEVRGADVASLNLDVIENADADTQDKFEGQVVLRISPGGPLPNSPAGTTSYEFAGAVLAIYKRTPIEDDPGTGDDFLLIFDLTNNTYFEDLAENFAVVTNR